MVSPLSDVEQDQSSRFGERSSISVSETTDLTSRPNKRRRIALACSNCRHRKQRCDGGRPKCALCCEIGCACVYEQAGTTTSITVGKSYISSVERRLVDIENTLKQLQQTQCSVHPDSANPIIRDEAGLQADRRNAVVTEGSISDQTPSQFVYSNNGEIGEIDTTEDAIDGMGAIQFTDEEDCGYFGPSSNIAFVRHISLAITQRNEQRQSLSSATSHARMVAGWMSVSRPHHAQQGTHENDMGASHRSINIYALPTEARTWSLLKEYFQKTGQLLPFVHEESFYETYFQLKRNNFTMARRTWLGLLNIIFAMATTLFVEENMSAEERIEESDVYYQRAHGLCDKESRRNISLELVQYLLILGQYLQGTQKSVQAWTVHGLAITTAFQLGLHSPRTNQNFSPIECEIRKRVWFGCILLDRTLSMTFGRPSIIPDRYVKLDLPLANLRVLGRTPQTETGPQMDANCFTATIKLYNVMYHVIDTCYDQNFGLEDLPAESELISLVLKGQRELDEWKNRHLPPLELEVYDVPLGPDDLEKMESKDLIVERFDIVLSLRYHNLRILLHRPILEKFLDAYGGYNTATNAVSFERNMLQQIGISSIETCVDSATIIISVVHTVVLASGWRRDLLGAWNYSLFYTFNAGLVLCAAVLVSPKKSAVDPSQSSSRWSFLDNSSTYLNMAIEALRNLDRGNRVVQRCVDYLSHLSLTVLNLHTPNGLDSNNGLVPAHGDLPDNTIFGTNDVHSSQPSTQVPQQIAISKEWPTEVDLSEFMLDTDLDLFARHFDVNSQY